MPWVKNFDTDRVLAKAMHRFWRQGYEATSMQDLVDCMGINRGSIYATFGSKRDLFVLALKAYDRNFRDGRLSALASENPPKQAVIAAFDGAVAEGMDGVKQEGCFLVNTALEMSPHDQEIAQVVEEGLTGTGQFFFSAIERGQQQGEIAPALDARQVAHALLGLFIGLRVLSRSHSNGAVLHSIVDQAKNMLER